MGLSSSKSKSTTTSAPPAWAEQALINGVNNTQSIFNQQQPRTNQMADIAQQAYNQIAPGAFQTSPFVQNAQGVATNIANGQFLNSNPGAATYTRLQQPANDPSMGLLQGFANGDGKVTGNAPSAGLYDSLINGDPAQNPYVDALVNRASDDAIVAANRRFGAAGQGAGVSGALGQNIAKGVADASNAIRYQAYDDAANRQLQAAGQSDAAFNAAQDRDVTQRAQNLAAAQALGQQYGQGEDRALEAAKSADTSQQSQIAQILTSLGLTGGLSDAQYAGVNPALNLLTASAEIPYYGLSALSGSLNNLAGRYGTTTGTSTTSNSIGSLLGGLGASALGGWAQSGFA